MLRSVPETTDPAEGALGSERRSEGRTATVFRPVLIAAEEFAGFCLVRNLSPKGMMGRVYVQFAGGLPVFMQFTDTIVVAGVVAWSRDGHIGVRFDKPVDIDRILGELGRKSVGRKINRAPRLDIRCRGELVVDGGIHPIDVLNISQRGLGVKAFCFLAPDQEVQVRLNGLDPRKAIVRWTQFDMAGVNFIGPLGFAELAEWVVGLQIGRSGPAQPGWRTEA
jgi:hypothetical protein